MPYAVAVAILLAAELRLAMARSAQRALAWLLLAVAASTMLCFVGTTPAPAVGTPLQQAVRSPAVHMEARGGEGALGDMTPDTYILGITVFCVASLLANMQGFFNP